MNPMGDTQRWFELERLIKAAIVEPDMKRTQAVMNRDIRMAAYAPRQAACDRTATLQAAATALGQFASMLGE
jgi:hypothetical protein